MKILFVFSFSLFLLSSAGHAAETPASSAPAGSAALSSLNEQAAKEFKRGAWDASEQLYLKAAQSYLIDERIEAYKGMEQLYKKVKLMKKAARTHAKLESEKEFLKKLIPADESLYETYTVKKGETYGRIAYRNEISEEWLKRVNKGKLLVEGRKIKLPKIKDVLIVDKEKKTLVWKRADKVIKTYPISIGKEGSETPEGEFKITEKVENPIWYHEGKEIPPDSPENLLGTRWLGFDKKSYAIHGTRHPGTIGTAASHGCVRMHNREVEELFEWVQVGTKVIIHNGPKPEGHLSKP